MTKTIPITYGEFHDFSRMIEFEFDGQWFLMRSYFDEEKDDYAPYYDVYLLPFRSVDELRAHSDYWMKLDKAVHLGQIPITDIGLDPTRRKSIDASSIEKWLHAHKAS